MENKTSTFHFHFTFLICAVVCQTLGDLHDSGGAQTGCAQSDELLSVIDGGNAACGLDLHMGSNVLGKQLHIGEGSACGGEASGGLDVVSAGVGDTLAQGDLLLIGEQAGFDDDLQKFALAGSLNGSNFCGDFRKFALLPSRC